MLIPFRGVYNVRIYMSLLYIALFAKTTSTLLWPSFSKVLLGVYAPRLEFSKDFGKCEDMFEPNTLISARTRYWAIEDMQEPDNTVSARARLPRAQKLEGHPKTCDARV